MADNTEDDSGPDTAPAQAAPQAAPAAQAQKPFNLGQGMYDWLVSQGVKSDVAYGAIGSHMGESGRSLNTKSVNPGDGSDGSDSLGVAQWNGARAQNLKSTASSMNMPWSSGEAQLEHWKNELLGKYSQGNYGHVLEALKGANSVADGNNIVTRQYEVPANADAQVAIRQKYGQGLADAAAAGTLDWNKLGGMGPSQNMQNPRSFQASAGPALGAGALGGDNIAGGNLGALFGGEPKSTPFSDGLMGIASSLASINNPSQAQALQQQLAAAHGKQKDPLTQALQRAQLMQYMKKQNEPEADPNALTFQKLAPDGKTPLYTDASGKLVDGNHNVITEAPQAPAAAPDWETDTKAVDKANNQKNISLAGMNHQTIDTANELMARFNNSPEIQRYIGLGQDARATIDNSQNMSNPGSIFVKDLKAFTNKAVVGIIGDLPGKAQNIPMQKREEASIYNDGGLNDAAGIKNVIGRTVQRATQTYSANMAPILKHAEKYGDTLPFLDPYGTAVKPADYHAANLQRWKDNSATNEKDYNEKVVPFHNQRTGAAPPVSRVNQILQYNGVQ